MLDVSTEREMEKRVGPQSGTPYFVCIQLVVWLKPCEKPAYLHGLKSR